MENEISPLEKTVIDNIRRIRQKKGISQTRLSIFSGTSASYIGLMETYKNIPKLSTIERIAQALDVPVLQLFCEQSNASSTPEESSRSVSKKKMMKEQVKNEILNRLGTELDTLLNML